MTQHTHTPLSFSRLSFVLLLICFAMQKHLSLVRDHLFMFPFAYFALGYRAKKKKRFLKFMSLTVIPVFF